MAEPLIVVEVVHASVTAQVLESIEVPAGSTARQAVLLSSMGQQFPALDLAECPLGIFGKSVSDDRVLAAGDRVEIYRPLLADPKEIRRLRAAKAARARLDSQR